MNCPQHLHINVFNIHKRIRHEIELKIPFLKNKIEETPVYGPFEGYYMCPSDDPKTNNMEFKLNDPDDYYTWAMYIREDKKLMVI